MGRVRTGRLIRRAVQIGTIAVLIGLMIADRRGWLLVRRCDDMALYHGVEASVCRVIDGDTLEIDRRDPLYHRPTTRVRLWGVDCPELAGPDRAAEAHGEQAAALARVLTSEGPVLLWLEPHRTRGSFGRLLAHVELPDGRCLNEALLEAGLAVADDRWPHTMLTRYAQAQRLARRHALGRWSEPTD